MPGKRDPNKALASFWMHKDVYEALGILAKVSNTTMTRLILEALEEKLGFTLDEAGNPVGLDLERLTKEAFSKSREVRKKTHS